MGQGQGELNADQPVTRGNEREGYCYWQYNRVFICKLNFDPFSLPLPHSRLAHLHLVSNLLCIPFTLSFLPFKSIETRLGDTCGKSFASFFSFFPLPFLSSSFESILLIPRTNRIRMFLSWKSCSITCKVGLCSSFPFLFPPTPTSSTLTQSNFYISFQTGNCKSYCLFNRRNKKRMEWF